MIWTSHLKSQKEKKEFEELLRLTNRQVLERLDQILDSYQVSIDKNETSLKQYDSPSWPYLQAHQNGMRQGLSMVQDLFKAMRG